MEKYNCRNDVPEKYKWDLTSFFKDDKDYEQNIKHRIKILNDQFASIV